MPGPVFKAEIRLDANGRAKPIFDRYGPDWDIGNTLRGVPTINGGRVFLEDRDELRPGESCVARIEPVTPELWGRVREGSLITMREGAKTVGYGRIVEIVDRPVYWTREVALFIYEAHEFCDFVDHAHELSVEERLVTGRQRLLDLYVRATALPTVAVTDDDGRRAEKRRPTSLDFGDFDFYYVVFNPYEDSQPVGGSLEDDFLDIYQDLQTGLALWETEASRLNAIWHWRFLFDTHWGNHASSALRALHHACNPLR